MSSRRALFFSWGNGSGHVTRLLDLADRARDEGWDTTIATHSNPLHLDLISESGHTLVRYPDHLVPSDPWACWADDDFLEKSFGWDSDLIGSVGPDLVVHDSRLSTMIAAATSGTRYASICQQVQLPGFVYPGLNTQPIWTRPVASTNARLRRSNLEQTNGDVRELYVRGRVLVPSIPEIDPIPESLTTREIVHVGPLRARSSIRPGSSMPQDVVGGQDVFFYRTVGPGSDQAKFADVFADIADRVHIATGNPAITAELLGTLRDYPFHVATFLNLDELRPHLGAAVIHGGHGITLTCVSTALPAVVLPGNNPERNLNGTRLAASGYGSVLGVEVGSFSWGDSVDVTGYLPGWRTVRDTLDSLLITGLAPSARTITNRVTKESATTTFSMMLGVEHN